MYQRHAYDHVDMNKKIIAIVCPIKDQILRVQSVRALIESISSNQEFEVIVFSEFDHNDIVYAKSFISNSASYIILKKNCQPGMSRLFTALMHWRPIILKTNKSSPFECIIAVDKWGLLMLPLLGKLDVRVVYLNLELRIISETKRASRKIVNWIEGVLHRNINCTIIQDPWREKAIRLEHKLPETHPVMLLPNSPLGISINATSSSFKRNHGIPESDIVILYV